MVAKGEPGDISGLRRWRAAQTHALFFETMSVSFQIHLCFEWRFVFFIITVYYSTVSPRVNKYNGCLQSNYRLIQMFNKVNYFTIRSTFNSKMFSFALFTAAVGVGVGTFPIYSLFMFSHNSLQKAMKNNSLLKKLNCNQAMGFSKTLKDRSFKFTREKKNRRHGKLTKNY